MIGVVETRTGARRAGARAAFASLTLCLLILSATPLTAQVRKFARFETGGRIAWGLVEADGIHELASGLLDEPSPTGVVHDPATVRLLAPAEPRQVIAVGLNYKSHIGDAAPAAEPGIFLKTPMSIVGPGESVVLPPGSSNVHFESEMVLVIGRRTKNVSVEDAPRSIFGITAGNDVSARIWQRDDLQWFRGKALDTFGPLGPYVVTGLDWSDLELVGRLNGEEVQRSSTSLLIFGPAEIVSYLSRYLTLLPGDVIFTGTPGRTRAMAAGDRFEVDLEGVGVLSNPIVQGD